jgi:hypothetical protein
VKWKDILKAPTDDLAEWKKDRQSYMLKDKVWREAGGNHSRNAYRDDPTSEETQDRPNSDTGFRFAKIEEIEEILDRKMTVDDFQTHPLSFSNPLLDYQNYSPYLSLYSL